MSARNATTSAPQPGDRSPERQRLAEAIKAATAARKRLDKGRQAVALAEEMEAKAQDALDLAREELQAAQEARAAEIATAATQGRVAAGGTRGRQARDAIAEAEDELEALRQALATVREPLDDLEYLVAKAEEEVRLAIVAVVGAELPAAIRAYEMALKHAAVSGRILYALRQLSFDQDHKLPPDVAAWREYANNLLGSFSVRSLEHVETSLAPAPAWMMTAERLKTDPDAPFPEQLMLPDPLPGEPGPAQRSGITSERVRPHVRMF